ncbi:hypothetical protein [uncultured Alistipes sp.]|uniref:hypothetical protein n=1 Tax=uncultured Alistipes sp. TaxID=538949 RepID=UPI00262F2F3E|nr:hypothetical protein [uncultured Alistipes sp.]
MKFNTSRLSFLNTPSIHIKRMPQPTPQLQQHASDAGTSSQQDLPPTASFAPTPHIIHPEPAHILPKVNSPTQNPAVQRYYRREMQRHEKHRNYRRNDTHPASTNPQKAANDYFLGL